MANEKSRSSRRLIPLFIAPLIVGLILAIVEFALPQIPNIVGAKEPLVTITHAYDGAPVEMREMIRGTSERIPKGQVVWIVVYPQKVGHYYPHDDPADLQANGDWSSLAGIGVEEDIGERFDIIAVLANKAVQDAFNAYLAQAEATTTWPGFETLPNGAVIYDRITVTRK